MALRKYVLQKPCTEDKTPEDIKKMCLLIKKQVPYSKLHLADYEYTVALQNEDRIVFVSEMLADNTCVSLSSEEVADAVAFLQGSDYQDINRCFIEAAGKFSVSCGDPDFNSPVSVQFVWGKDGGVTVCITTDAESAVVTLQEILISSCLHAERLFAGENKRALARQAMREYLQKLVHYFEEESEEYLMAAEIKQIMSSGGKL